MSTCPLDGLKGGGHLAERRNVRPDASESKTWGRQIKSGVVLQVILVCNHDLQFVHVRSTPGYQMSIDTSVFRGL